MQAPDTASPSQLMQPQAPETIAAAVVAETGSDPVHIDHAPGVAKPKHCDSSLDALNENEPHMHISTFRLRVLTVGANISKHARYITIHACSAALHAWQRFLNHFK